MPPLQSSEGEQVATMPPPELSEGEQGVVMLPQPTTKYLHCDDVGISAVSITLAIDVEVSNIALNGGPAGSRGFLCAGFHHQCCICENTLAINMGVSCTALPFRPAGSRGFLCVGFQPITSFLRPILKPQHSTRITRRKGRLLRNRMDRPPTKRKIPLPKGYPFTEACSGWFQC